jgi:hypothetical protein
VNKTKAMSLIAILFALVTLDQRLLAQRGWEYLGEANVDGQVDHDNIKVTAAEGTFRAIRMRVENAPIRFDRVVIHYGDGESQPIMIRSKIGAGGQTRVIDLPGDRRVIQGVEFWYERASGSPAKPKVRLFGLH